MTDFPALLKALSGAGVEFIVVGGAAGVGHGAVRLTVDLDVLYRRTGANLDRIVAALAPIKPYPRDAPAGLPFQWDRRTVELGLNFTLRTTIGLIDLLGEIAGGDFDKLRPHSILLKLYGVEVLCLDLDALIYTKRAAGRPKDYEAIAELETIRDENQEHGPA